MKLSIWILAEWLKKYQPEIRIEKGEMVLRGTRILSNDTTLEPHNVYLAYGKDFITDGDDRVICVQGHDMLILNTNDAEEVFNCILDAFDFYNNWYDGLFEAIQDGCSIQHILDDSYRVFHRPLIIYDADHIAQAYSLEFPKGSLDTEWDILLDTGSNSLWMLEQLKTHILRTRQSHKVMELNFPFVHGKSYQRILFQNEILVGRIILMTYYQSCEPHATSQLLDVLGSLTEYWQSCNTLKNLKSESELFKRLISDQPVTPQELNHQLLLAGWKPDDSKVLLEIVIPDIYSQITHPLLSNLANTLEDSYVFLLDRSIYLLVNTTFCPEMVCLKEIQKLMYHSMFLCAVSYPFTDVFELKTYAEQCHLTLQSVDSNQKGIYYCKDFAFSYLLSTIPNAISSAVIHPALKILLEEDKKNHSSLYHTLFAYLIHNCSLLHTANALHLHRNSLLYRINKITELTGICLDDPQERQYLYLSYIIKSDFAD